MRWSVKDRSEWRRRYRKGFLLLPREMDGEWRWLEYAEWEEVYAGGRWQLSHWLEPEAVDA